MGKGDLKTLKGKRYNSSYGNVRPHAAKAAAAPAAGKGAVKPTGRTLAKKTVAKKGA